MAQKLIIVATDVGDGDTELEYTPQKGWRIKDFKLSTAQQNCYHTRSNIIVTHAVLLESIDD